MMDKTFKIKRCAVRLTRINTTLLQEIVEELENIGTPRIRNCTVRLHRCHALGTAAAVNGNSVNGAYMRTSRNGSVARSDKSMTPIVDANNTE